MARHLRLAKHIRSSGTQIDCRAFRQWHHLRPYPTRRRCELYHLQRRPAVAKSNRHLPSRHPDPLTTTCYTITTKFEGSTQTSHPAAFVCIWGDNADHVNSVYADDLTIQGGSYATTHGRPHHDNWGEPGHTIQGEIFISESGRHLLQAVYGNGAGSLDSGITAAVKWARVYDSNGMTIAEGPLVMPQLGSWDEWSDSSFLSFGSTSLSSGVL